MVVLKRVEEIEMYQVELSIKKKAEQSPFIAILMLAHEQGEITPYSLQQNLLHDLPIRACETLLKRLGDTGYLTFDDDFSIGYNKYILTELGEKSAKDKTFWAGEKGVYNVYVSTSNLISQKIIQADKAERMEDDRNSRLINTPDNIYQYEQKRIWLNKSEVLIEGFENTCFGLKPATCILEIHVKGNDAVIKVIHNGQSIFTSELTCNEETVREELLLAATELNYNREKKVILVPFDKNNLSLTRNVQITKPIFKRNTFNSIGLENIAHLPEDDSQAELWYKELLYKNISNYFLDDKSFAAFAREKAKPFQLH